MTRTCYDSTTASDLPKGGDVYLAYVDGSYANLGAVRARNPHATLIRTTTGSGTLDADMADIERGDYTPPSGAQWARRKESRDGYAGLYCELSQWSEVKAEVRKLGVPNVWYIVAGYDGVAVIPAGAVGKQYSSPDVPGGSRAKAPGHYDTSVVADYIPGVDPKPKPLSARQQRLLRAQRLIRRAIRLLNYRKGNK